MPHQQPVNVLMKRRKVLDIQETDSVTKALELLDEANISALPVRSPEGKYSGVLSKSDIASRRFLRALKIKRSPDQVLVREIMNRTPPLFVMENDPIREAIGIMHRRHIHRLFVADESYQLIGVISTTDILRLLVLKT
ncbi:MAG TPA: CBS domain-containing protein [Coleofasciculaceae cyanobacterium]